LKLAVALAWHALPFEDLLALVRRAEDAGFAAVFVDGDVSQLASRGDGDVLDGWTLTTALIAKTARIPIGSIRLVHHWNTARLAQAVATLERVAPERLRFLCSIGAQPADARFGLPFPTAADRITWLDESLGALRRLWAGEDVRLDGRFVRLAGARVRPLPRGGRMPIEVAGRGPRLLDVVAAHANVWDLNLPPLARCVSPAVAALEEACRRRSRDPASIARSMWIFTRPGLTPGSAALREAWRRWNPWFADVSELEIDEAAAAGPGAACRDRIESLTSRFGLDHPVADLSGLPADAARQALDALTA